jgi:hypothetical protein
MSRPTGYPDYNDRLDFWSLHSNCPQALKEQTRFLAAREAARIAPSLRLTRPSAMNETVLGLMLGRVAVMRPQGQPRGSELIAESCVAHQSDATESLRPLRHNEPDKPPGCAHLP